MGKYDNKHFLVNNWEESRKLQQILIEDGYKGVGNEPYECTKQYPHYIGAYKDPYFHDSASFSWSTCGGDDAAYWDDENSVLTLLPWITEKYYKKYFKVESKEDLSRLQQYLFDAGYTLDTGETVFKEHSNKYPYVVGVGCVKESHIGWNYDLGKFYESEGMEFMELPWKSEEKSYTEIEDSTVSEPLIIESDSVYYIDEAKLEAAMLFTKNSDLEWTDKHYNFNVDVSDKDTLKVDPYFVSKTWQIGSKDESGALFHILKTISRFGSKNTREREIKAIYKQIVRLAELEGVELEGQR